MGSLQIKHVLMPLVGLLILILLYLFVYLYKYKFIIISISQMILVTSPLLVIISALLLDGTYISTSLLSVYLLLLITICYFTRHRYRVFNVSSFKLKSEILRTFELDNNMVGHIISIGDMQLKVKIVNEETLDIFFLRINDRKLFKDTRMQILNIIKDINRNKDAGREILIFAVVFAILIVNVIIKLY